MCTSGGINLISSCKGPVERPATRSPRLCRDSLLWPARSAAFVPLELSSVEDCMTRTEYPDVTSRGALQRDVRLGSGEPSVDRPQQGQGSPLANRSRQDIVRTGRAGRRGSAGILPGPAAGRYALPAHGDSVTKPAPARCSGCITVPHRTRRGWTQGERCRNSES